MVRQSTLNQPLIVKYFCMNIPSNLPRLKGFRHPREVISYTVWAYHRFALSTADVEDLLAERGVNISREAVRLWVNHLGRRGWQLRISCAATSNQSATSPLMPIIGRIRGGTTRSKSRTGQPESEKRYLVGSSHCAELINLIFCPRRDKLTSISYRHARADAFRLWQENDRLKSDVVINAPMLNNLAIPPKKEFAANSTQW